MKTEFMGYTLLCDFTKDNYYIPTYVIELDLQFMDLADAMIFIERLCQNETL